MSVEGLSNQIMESLKETLIDKITELIPNLIKELLPSIINLSKDIIIHHLQETNLVEDCIQEERNTKKEFDQFKHKHQYYFTKKLDEIKDEYYKHEKCKRISELYDRIIENNSECPDTNETYVPRKFRKDDYYAMSKAELDAISRFEQERLKSERDILKLRRQEYFNRIEKIDADISNFIKTNNISSPTKELAINRWNECISEDSDKVDIQWQKKIESTKESFKRDKEFLQNHQKTRLKHQKEESTHDASIECEQNDFQVNNNRNSNSSNSTIRSSTSRNDDQSKNVRGQRHRFNLRSNRR